MRERRREKEGELFLPYLNEVRHNSHPKYVNILNEAINMYLTLLNRLRRTFRTDSSTDRNFRYRQQRCKNSGDKETIAPIGALEV